MKIFQESPMKFQLNKTHLLIILLFCHSLVKAGLYYELKLEEKVANAQFIVAGKVIKIETIRNTDQQILTQYVVEISAIFKSDTSALERITLTTTGGFLEDEGASGDCFHYPQPGDEGIFFIQRKNNENRLYGEKQGFVAIDYSTGTYYDFFHHYPNGDTSYLPQLLQLCPTPIKVLSKPPVAQEKQITLVNITSIQPLTETAGTGSLLTIKGIGLGANQFAGTLYFTNANDGGNTFFSVPPELIVKWTDTEVISKIPALAGTGKIRIETATGFDNSSQILTLKAARINTGENSALYESRLVKRNPNGGYLLNKNEKFALDANASLAVKNALIQWRCQTGINWTLGKNTSITGTARDTINSISFDDKGQLPAGAIGLCYSYFKSCGSNVWYLDEFDMLFKENFNWYYGEGNPAVNQYDFYTVALHEFGHAHQLGHVIKSTDLMHYSIAPGEQKRSISNENADLCYEIVSEGVSKNTCDYDAHLSIPPSVCSDEKYGFFKTLIYPNPAAEKISIDLFFTDKNTITLQLYSINGELVMEKQYTPPNAERLSLEIPMRENNLNAGVYVLKIFGELELATEKIILY